MKFDVKCKRCGSMNIFSKTPLFGWKCSSVMLIWQLQKTFEDFAHVWKLSSPWVVDLLLSVTKLTTKQQRLTSSNSLLKLDRSLSQKGDQIKHKFMDGSIWGILAEKVAPFSTLKIPPLKFNLILSFKRFKVKETIMANQAKSLAV